MDISTVCHAPVQREKERTERRERERNFYLANPSSINAFHLERQRGGTFLLPTLRQEGLPTYCTLPSHAAIQREEGKRNYFTPPCLNAIQRDPHTEGDFLTSLLSCHAVTQRGERNYLHLHPVSMPYRDRQTVMYLLLCCPAILLSRCCPIHARLSPPSCECSSCSTSGNGFYERVSCIHDVFL